MSPSAYPGLAVASWMDQAGLVGTVVGAATSLLKGRHVSHAGFVWRLDTTYSHTSWAMACLVLGRFAPACEVRSSGQADSFPPDSCAAKISPPCRSEVAQNLHPPSLRRPLTSGGHYALTGLTGFTASPPFAPAWCIMQRCSG
ncbi:hypothetical protein PAAG_05306 [Paracoccidioides lutzii Pb01]|uniref:Uncharacterized protein n=1 Tax=Paracoccidioides lutzii (strain ATCC MYA-826 / Pb01) TaxID=502779 RepID=C1H3G3_PARBA|nr:hypothetical protein PAAG_05306 [Paracoccidioides lutzii Pb01]EEH34257.1 hypothetical protein PAAG_05306 [Paracoccidioides lutzii Pb01]